MRKVGIKRIFDPETVDIRKENPAEDIWSQERKPVMENETNDELDKLIKHQNIINHIKAPRLSWFGHVQRMPDSRTVTKIFNWTPLTSQSKGRPKQRWEDNIIQDIRQLNIKNWTVCVQDRTKWKNVVENDKTFNNRSLAPEEE